MPNDQAAVPTMTANQNQSSSGTMIIQGYHRTKSLSSPESIAYQGYDLNKSGNNGSLYGSGFYMTRNMIDHLASRYDTQYGAVIIKNEVNMKDVLICDLALSIKVFGRPVNIWQQFVDKGIKLSPSKTDILLECSQACERAVLDNSFTSEQAKKLFERNIVDTKLWAGMAYTGEKDGACLVMYKPEQVSPRTWAHYDAKDIQKLFVKENNLAKDFFDDDDEDDDDDRDSMIVATECGYKHFVAEKLVWNALNKREVDKIRQGFPPRFSRWLTLFAKMPKDKAQTNFNTCVQKLTPAHCQAFIYDIAHHSKSPAGFKYANELLKNTPSDCLTAMLNNCAMTDYSFACNNKAIINFNIASKSEFWAILIKHAIFNDHLIRWAKLWHELVAKRFADMLQQSLDTMLSLTGKEFNDAIYYNSTTLKRNINFAIADGFYGLRDQQHNDKYITVEVRDRIRKAYRAIVHDQSAIGDYALKLLAMPAVYNNLEVLALVTPLFKHINLNKTYKPTKMVVAAIEIVDMEPDLSEMLKEDTNLLTNLLADLALSYNQSLVENVVKRKTKARSPNDVNDDDEEDDEDDDE